MSKATVFLLSAPSPAVATLAVGIRGLKNGEPCDLSGYYVLLMWAARDVYRRRVAPAAG